MKATEVTPAAWKEIRILYDNNDENYSAIWGKYKGEKCLGVRWRGKGRKRGYPGQGKHPLWYVEPDFLTLPILQNLLEKAIYDKKSKYKESIIIAIKEHLECLP